MNETYDPAARDRLSTRGTSASETSARASAVNGWTASAPSEPLGLRRELGRLESYATIIGILVGAGIFRVTSDAWSLTGSSVVLCYLALAPAVLATSVPYAVYLSTPLGRLPGGEYTHISRTYHSPRVAFVGVWVKIIAYLGALAFLSQAFADYSLQLGGLRGADAASTATQVGVALGVLAVFYVIHVLGVRWFGALQVVMFLILGVSIAVLVVPGLFAIEPANYDPVFTDGARGFASALPLLFFAYAGFESLAQAAGEVRESTRHLPGVFLRGIVATTLIFVGISAVAFGVLPGESLGKSNAPMATVARVYLPGFGATVVVIGALMAITTSINATMLVPSRLTVMLAADRLAPQWLGRVHSRTGTPVAGLTLTYAVAALLLVTRQLSLALNIAVLAMVVLYLLHSVALLIVPRTNPELFASRTVRMPRALMMTAAALSALAMVGLIVVIVHGDIRTLAKQGFVARVANGGWTSIELLLAWGALGLFLHALARRSRSTA
jgi:amino acid transporter